ncbi:MAG: dimethyl sulfoxide reductase anchor subunit [SAR324 cluster bacterium]|nr:dimethyl sulfoxide reductase anchor subunit [SAR324 cluster bacterium]
MNSILQPLKQGEQYAFEVDLSICTGCKGCVTACQNLNGLTPAESWRTVGVVESKSGDISQTITTSCHHCLDPACLKGCPVRAYQKDAVTGIVKHLDDQCIGCQYCILACPYDAPKWIPELGIVRKCDMCTDRLEVGEETACQQGCPNDAISIVTKSEAQIKMPSSAMKLPTQVSPEFTFPSTGYINGQVSTDSKSLNEERTAEKGHLPLVLMLVLSQFSVGLWGLSLFLEAQAFLSQVSLAILLAGLASSVFHLGKPLKSFKAFLGLSSSHLSREVLFFGTYAPLVIVTLLLGQFVALEVLPPFTLKLLMPLRMIALITGLLGVYSSAKLYQITSRPYWKGDKALLGFPLSGLILSSAFALTFSGPAEQRLLLPIILIGSLLWTVLEVQRNNNTKGLLLASSKLMSGSLKGYWILQQTFLWFCGILLPIYLLQVEFKSSLAIFTFYGLLGATFTERYLFFKAGLGYRMPIGEAG